MAMTCAIPTWAGPVLADDETWSSVDAKAWKAIAPSTDRVALIGLDAEGERIEIPGRWSLLAPGDTLHFAVRGEGAIQVQSRSLFEGQAKSRRYRLGVVVGPGDRRNLVRESAFASMVRWNDTMQPRRMAELDRWKTELVVGAQRISLTLRETKSAPVLVRVLARGRIEVPVSEHERGPAGKWKVRSSLELLTLGYDSNAYLTPKDATDSTDVSDAWYWPVVLGAAVEWQDALPFDLAAAYEFSTRQYEDAILDQTRHELNLRESWSRLHLGALGRGSLRIEQRLRIKDETFFGRGSTEEFETASDINPGSNVALGDRFDWREFGLGAQFSMLPSAAWELELSAEWARRDYAEDYEAEPDIYSLDQDRYGVQLTVDRALASQLAAKFQAGVLRQDYDEKFARDKDGVEQPGLDTQLRRWPFELGLRRQLPHRSWLKVALDALITQDLREGYWDRSSIGITAEGKWKGNGPWECGLRVHRSMTDYERSTVGNDVGAPIREKDNWRTRLDGNYVLRDHWQLFGSFSYANLENNSSKFAYDRAELEIGVRGEF